jgi:WXXGXW repeat (2 copies)
MSGIKIGAFVGPMLLAATLSSAEVHVNVYVPTRPPALIVETHPVAPAAGYVWVPGYHRWDGGAYLWVGGRWELPPQGHTRWVSGSWRHHKTHGWYWTDGHWR